MNNVTSIKKLSKKQRKEYYAKKRNTWGFSPICRVKPSAKVYDRKKNNRRNDDNI